jgi:hypothetical protein
MKIIEDEEQSLDDLVVRARTDSKLKKILNGKPVENAFEKVTSFADFVDSGVDMVASGELIIATDAREAQLISYTYEYPDKIKLDHAISKFCGVALDVSVGLRSTIAAIYGHCLKIFENQPGGGYEVNSEFSYSVDPTSVSYYNNRIAVCVNGQIKVYANDHKEVWEASSFNHPGIASAAFLDDEIMVRGDKHGFLTVTGYNSFGFDTDFKESHIELPAGIRKIATRKNYIAVTSEDNMLRVFEYLGDGMKLIFETWDNSFGVALNSPDAKYLLTSSNIYRRK